MRNAPAALIAFALMVAGCSSPPPVSYSLTFPTLTVPAGTERTQCIIKRLGNAAKMHVGQIHNVLGPSSHHMIVYRVNDTVEQPTPFDCVPFTETLDPTQGSPLMITQKKDDLLELPPTVAYTLQPNQMLRIELHYINATQAPVELTATTTMTSTANYKIDADFLFMGNADIALPPGTTTTLGPTYFPMAQAQLGEINVFALTGHEHHLGTGVTVATASSTSDSGTTVYNPPNWLWSEPATVRHDPPFQIGDADYFKFTCTWDNTSTSTVTFGESANDEMCFFWAYYYPSRGSEVCITTQRQGGHTFCCPGAVECAYILSRFGGMK
jgi:hypothetical protein